MMSVYVTIVFNMLSACYICVLDLCVTPVLHVFVTMRVSCWCVLQARSRHTSNDSTGGLCHEV